MKKYVVLLASAMAFATAAHAEDKPAEGAAVIKSDKSAGPDYVIMRIGQEEVKRSEIEKVWKVIFPGGTAPDFETLDSRIKNNLLRGIANEHIMLREAKKSALMESPEVKDRLRTAENQVLIQEFLREKTKDAVTDEKIKAAYDEQIKNRPAGQEELHARHILVKTEAEAKAIVKKLKKGASFEDLAKEKSEDKTSGMSGGDLGWFNAERMTPEFSKAAFALKKGEVSEPIKSEFGWHIIKAEDRRVSPPPTLELMREEIKNQLARKAVMDYIQSVTKDEKVSVFDAKGMEKPLPAEPPAPVAPAGASAEK